MQLWKEHEQLWNLRFFYPIGVLWMAGENDPFERGSLPELQSAGIPYQELGAEELTQRWPQVNFDGIRWGIYEPESGYLLARASCQAVVEAVLGQGGDYLQLEVSARSMEQGNFRGLPLSDGTLLAADQYVFACGPWMGRLFPEAIGARVKATKQDVFFFGTPPGDHRFDDIGLPVWGDHSDQFMYGIPGNQFRGFKIADDTRGPEFDPSSGERRVGDPALASARRYMEWRFPGMKGAPLLETRVCQYEQTPDENFILDRHPAASNVWLVGGGSGHGFKHGPALGEMVAQLVMEGGEPEPLFRLDRLSGAH